MRFYPAEILEVLDKAAASFAFPMLDNGYVYPAAARMSLFRSDDDWGLVIETFGYSPRAGWPDITIETFASRPQNRKERKDYTSEQDYQDYLRNNPHNEFRTVHPIAEGDWLDPDDQERVAPAGTIRLRGQVLPLPAPAEYANAGVMLENEGPAVFELCRVLAGNHRDMVLATPAERRVNILPEMTQILQLEEWHHPDLADNEVPSHMESFRRLAEVLATGDVSRYRPTENPNTHWSNWPNGGSL